MTYLALDLSKRSTGWALWRPGTETPRYGHWVLGSEWTTPGGVFAKLHRNMADLYKIEPFDKVYYEAPINPAQLQGGTNIDTLLLASGLAAHVQSFGNIKRCRITKGINISTWRLDFIGRDASRAIKREAKAAQRSARDPLKAATMQRCRDLGLSPSKDDEADAIGILTYAVMLNDITPPWLANPNAKPEGAML